MVSRLVVPQREGVRARVAGVGSPRSQGYAVAKRLLDVVGALVLLVLSLPMLVILAVVIVVDSPGLPVFRQQRVGRDGHLFWFYKFRTMYTDARARFPELYDYRFDAGEIQTMLFKLPHDPRCTRIGRHLRRTSLDELPNLFNVLRGDISLVGPRPEIPEMVAYYRPEHLSKFTVKPGLTGLAQVSGRNILPWIKVAEADASYVANRSFSLDLRILARTVVAVVTRVGAL